MRTQTNNTACWLYLFLFLVVMLVGAPELATARTWYVKNDGSGDAPTIQAAVDSAVSGDSVLVGAGTYELSRGIQMKAGVDLVSEHGPVETRLVPMDYEYPYDAIYCQNISEDTEVCGFWIDGFIWASGGGGALDIEDCQNLYIHHNIFTDNDNAGISIYSRDKQCNVWIEHNTFVTDRSQTYAIIGGNNPGLLQNNIIWGVAHSIDWFYYIACNCMMDKSDADVFAPYNIELDPEFCGTAESWNLFLQSDSPCAPGNTPEPLEDCGLIGALPVGCGTAPVKRSTWGQIKDLYRR
jgi:hypothetical protein